MIQALTAAVSDLKGSPALLAVVLMQLITLILVYFVSTANAGLSQQRDQLAHERELALIEQCGPP